MSNFAMIYIKCLFGNFFAGFKNFIIPILGLLLISFIVFAIPSSICFVLAYFYHLSFEPMLAASFAYYADLTTDIFTFLLILSTIIVWPYAILRAAIVGLYKCIAISLCEARAKYAMEYYKNDKLNRKK